MAAAMQDVGLEMTAPVSDLQHLATAGFIRHDLVGYGPIESTGTSRTYGWKQKDRRAQLAISRR